MIRVRVYGKTHNGVSQILRSLRRDHLQLQGNSSLSHPKKNFTVNLYANEERNIKLNKEFKTITSDPVKSKYTFSIANTEKALIISKPKKK